MNFLKKFNRKIFRIETWGGLGDGLLHTPVFKALKETYPTCRVDVYYTHKIFKEIYKNNPYVDRLIRVKIWHLWFKPLFKLYHTYFQFVPPTYLKQRKHAKELIAEIFGVKLKDKKLQVYLTKQEEQEAKETMSKFKNPICIHVTSRNSKYHIWAYENWERLIRMMPEYTFIQLGQGDEYPIKGAIDFRGKTTVRGAIGMIKYAKLFAGIEASLAHAANAAGTPGVVIFSDSDVETFGHSENTNIFNKIPCAPCYYLLWGQDGCPYDSKCIKSITVEQVHEAILKLEAKSNIQKIYHYEEMLN
jgi:ADP-heptose:LPS heptosyltransferase